MSDAVVRGDEVLRGGIGSWGGMSGGRGSGSGDESWELDVIVTECD